MTTFTRPDVANRKAITEGFKTYSLLHWKNFLINTAMRFVMYRTVQDSFSVSKIMDESLSLMKKSLLNENEQIKGVLMGRLMLSGNLDLGERELKSRHRDCSFFEILWSRLLFTDI